MKRKQITSLLIGLLLVCSSGWADVSTTAEPYPTGTLGDKYVNEAKQPTFISMTADAVLARPALLAATIIGTGLFMVTLPFTLASNSVDQAGHTLVGVPFKATFERCLGCSFNEDKS